MVNIDYIMGLLDWNNSSEKQLLGIKLARDVKCINAFLQPGLPYGKNIWDNCAKILSERTDEELSPYLLELMEWLQDLNWPGVFIIIERLKVFSGDLLLTPYVQIINRIKDRPENDNTWLDNLTILLDNTELRERLDHSLFNFLKSRYNNVWNKC